MADNRLRSRKNKSRSLKQYVPVYIMMLPGLLYLIINNYIPMVGIVIAFKKYNSKKGIWGSDWNGFSNFKYLFATRDAATITRNTLVYNGLFIIVNTVLGIIIAMFICDAVSKVAKKIYQSAILLPFLMSWVIVGYIVYAFLSNENGILNNTILPALGKEAISWYNTPGYWWGIILLINTWKGVGYGALIYISTINGIDPTFMKRPDWMELASYSRFVTSLCLRLFLRSSH